MWAGLYSTSPNMRKGHLREYGHVQRKMTYSAAKKSDPIQVEETKHTHTQKKEENIFKK